MRTLIFTIFIFLSQSILSQKIQNIIIEQDINNINILYDLTGTGSNQLYKVVISCSIDGGNRFVLHSASGDVGDNIYGGKHKKIVWDVFQDVESINEVQFFIRAEPMNNDRQVKTTDYSQNQAIEYIIGYNGSITDYLGIKLGTLGKWGGYIAFKTYVFTDFSFVAGANKRIIEDNIYIYSGLGAGNWGWLNGNSDFWSNHIGIEYEAGILAKFNRLYFSIGPAFLYGDADNITGDLSFGIGYAFR